MEQDYRYKLAMKQAKADVKKALKEWWNSKTIGIDEILKSYGYTESSYRYEFTKLSNGYTIRLDTFDLACKGFDSIPISIE